MAVKRLRERQAEETRALLVAVARELFAERGYSSTSIEEVIQRAGVAKGALYHHFGGKEDLFRAVYDQIQAETITTAIEAAMGAGEPWDGVRAALSSFLDACLDPAFRRVVVLDSVSVLQHQAWAGGTEHPELAMLRTVLTPLVEARILPDVPIEPFTYIALGGLYGAALHIARSSDPAAARSDADTVLDTLAAGLRTAMSSQTHAQALAAGIGDDEDDDQVPIDVASMDE